MSPFQLRSKYARFVEKHLKRYARGGKVPIMGWRRPPVPSLVKFLLIISVGGSALFAMGSAKVVASAWEKRAPPLTVTRGKGFV